MPPDEPHEPDPEPAPKPNPLNAVWPREDPEPAQPPPEDTGVRRFSESRS